MSKIVRIAQYKFGETQPDDKHFVVFSEDEEPTWTMTDLNRRAYRSGWTRKTKFKGNPSFQSFILEFEYD